MCILTLITTSCTTLYKVPESDLQALSYSRDHTLRSTSGEEFTASPGDTVYVWLREGRSQAYRVGSSELRGLSAYEVVSVRVESSSGMTSAVVGFLAAVAAIGLGVIIFSNMSIQMDMPSSSIRH